MFWQDRGVTSSQVPTQTQRSNDTPTVRIQPVAATPEPAWPTAEPMTATNIPPVPASGVAFEPQTPPTNGHVPPSPLSPLSPPNGAANGTLNGVANGTLSGATNGTLNGAPNGTLNGAANGNGAVNGAVNGIPAAPAAPAQPAAAQPAAAEPAAGPTPDADPAPAAAPAAAPAKPAEPAKPRSRLRRIARRIVGPTLLTKKG